MSDSVVFPRNSADRLAGGRAMEADIRSSCQGRRFRRRRRGSGHGRGLAFRQRRHGRYLVLSLALPLLWMIAVRVFGGYEMRFLGTGSDEFRRVLNAGVSLTAALALISYAVNNELSRAYLAISMPVIVMLDLLVRFALRKRLHRRRVRGQCMSTVVAVGHEPAVEQLISELRREPYHGLEVVAACLAGESTATEVAGVPVVGDLDDTADVVRNIGAGTVAVLSCPEMDGMKLRTLAWELEKTGTDLCVAPALLDVAGPRTTIRPTAGLTLLHVDHPQLSGPRQVLKDLFDRSAAVLVLLVFSPLMLAVAVAIRLSDRARRCSPRPGSARTGVRSRSTSSARWWWTRSSAWRNSGRRTSSTGCCSRCARIRGSRRSGHGCANGRLTSCRSSSTCCCGEMSLVGPRPALPDEAARYADHVRRRLVVKPGLTGLWQVNGRSNLSWDETVRLDLRYVENWSFALDLQILWKTFSVIFRGAGAY